MPDHETLRIQVDPLKCVGSTMCLQFSPGVFALNDKRQACVVDPGAGSLETILEAAHGCPMMAITVQNLETGAMLFPPQR